MRKSVENIIDSIKSLKGLTRDYEVADMLGVSRAALSNAKQRDSISFLDELVKFCDVERLSLDFIRREPPVTEDINAVSAPVRIPLGRYNNYVEVPVYSYAGAGPGEAAGAEEIDRIVILRELCGEGSVVIRVKGDSMEKLFMNGTNAVIDTGVKELVSGCVYAVMVPWEGCIVRGCVSGPTGLNLIPYNKNYTASFIKWGDFDPGMIIGRVTCSVINVLV